MKWTIKFQNDGENEWWIVTNGKQEFRCVDPQDAEWLCDILNTHEILLDAH